MTDEAPSTKVLLRQAKSGDREALDRLFRGELENLRLYLRLRGGFDGFRGLDDEDVLQETYFHAVRDFESFEYRGARSFRGWLCGILSNRVRDLARHAAAVRRRPDGEQERFSRILDGVQDSATGPQTALVRGESQQRLAEAIELLDEDLREVVLLRHFEELNLDEIAARIAKTPSSTRRLLAKAMTALGRHLDGKAPS